MKPNKHFPIKFFLEWNFFQIKVLKDIEKHILCSINIFLKNRAILRWKKYDLAGLTTNENMAFAWQVA